MRAHAAARPARPCPVRGGARRQLWDTHPPLHPEAWTEARSCSDHGGGSPAHAGPLLSESSPCQLRGQLGAGEPRPAPEDPLIRMQSSRREAGGQTQSRSKPPVISGLAFPHPYTEAAAMVKAPGAHRNSPGSLQPPVPARPRAVSPRLQGAPRRPSVGARHVTRRCTQAAVTESDVRV